MPLTLIAAFWAVSFLFIIIPGADWAYAISAGIRGKKVIPAVAGLLSGHLFATIIVSTGLGSLIAGTPGVIKSITLVGAGYLLWLGIGVLRHPSVVVASEDQDVGSNRQWMLKGLCISALNPKVFLLFLALLPQFTDIHTAWPLPIQMIALGLVHVFSCGIIYFMVGYGSHALLRTRPQAAMRISQVSGFLMIIIAAFLLTE